MLKLLSDVELIIYRQEAQLSQKDQRTSRRTLSVAQQLNEKLLLLLLLLQPFYKPLGIVRNYLGEPVPER